MSTVQKPADFDPVRWEEYFTDKAFISVDSGADRFCVYSTASAYDKTLPVVFFHGAGHSALSWSLVAKILSEATYCRVFAIDIRGHGETFTEDESDLSAKKLASDMSKVLGTLGLLKDNLVLGGHSMGGALAIHTAIKLEAVGFTLSGLIVVDVVEGTAMSALRNMKAVLQNRPDSFPSINRAIMWSKSHMVRNVESAKVSTPGLLKVASTGIPVTKLLDQNAVIVNEKEADVEPEDKSPIPSPPRPIPPRPGNPLVKGLMTPAVPTLAEETSESEVSEDELTPPRRQPSDSGKSFVWRVNLPATEPHWESWFTGISKKFLSLPCPKVLVLAGVDRLDKDLTIGQMQGQFQVRVVPNVGHIIQEDSPDQFAELVIDFLVRQKLSDVKSSYKSRMVGTHPAFGPC